MRELKYFVACTVDRFIAREDGSFDFFLAEGAHLTDLVKTYPETVPAHLRDALGVRPELTTRPEAGVEPEHPVAGPEEVTPSPTASTSPANSLPRTRARGRVGP